MKDDESIPEETQTKDEGGEEPLPESTENNSAEEAEQTDAETQSEETEQESDDIKKWAESQGIDVDNPTPEQTAKLAQRLRDTQSKMHEATNKSAELESSVSDVVDVAETAGQIDANDARLLKMEQRLAVTQFFVNNPEARQYDKQMAEIVKQKPWLLNDLNDLHRLARLESSGESIDKITEKARQDERERLKQKQSAGIAKPSASSSTGSSKEVDDPIMRGLLSND